MGSGKMGNGHFVIAVTAVAAQVMVGEDPNTADTANALFPESLAEDMHGMGNIDACGTLRTSAGGDTEDGDTANNNLMHLDPTTEETCARTTT